jgi:uncharacterized protein (DUF362 family)/ferredoxin
MSVSLLQCTDVQEVLANLRSEFENRRNILPPNQNASIIIKPNLNSDLDALTGNTTDLRILGAVIRNLKERGYKNITIVEGPNGGFHRDGIDVFARNSIDKIALYYGCKFKDVNYEKDTLPLEFEGSGTVEIARVFKDCDFFINIPKLKTHYETLISVALKSLIGTLVGQPNKAKAHTSLHENILRLNDSIQADLHIVDGLIAMEGTGPSAGKPVQANLIIVGTNPYEIDIIASVIMGFEPKLAPLIQKAVETGRISSSFVDEIASIELPVVAKHFERPRPGFLAKMVVMPSLSAVVRKVKNHSIVSNLLKIVAVRRLMLFLGLTQEVIIPQDRNVKIKFNRDRCISCGKCSRYCPQTLELPKSLEQENDSCINCLYCYAVCPADAIEVEGELGYYKEQVRRYGRIIKAIT